MRHDDSITKRHFHVNVRWTDSIIELGTFKHGKVWFNGFPCDPARSEFAPKLPSFRLSPARIPLSNNWRSTATSRIAVGTATSARSSSTARRFQKPTARRWKTIC